MAPADNSRTISLVGLPLKRLILFAALFLLLSGAGIFVIYSEYAERELTFDPAIFSWPVVLSSIVLLGIYYGSDGLRLHFTLKALGHSLSLRQIFRLVFINIFFSNVTPMATGGGFAQIWYLQRKGVPLGTATAATTIRTVLAVIFIFAATPVFLLTLDALEGKAISGQIAAYLSILVTLYLAFFALLLFRTAWLLPPITVLIDSLRRFHVISQQRHDHWCFKSKREMLRFARSFAVYMRGRKQDILLSILFTFIFLLSLFSFPAILIWGLGYDTPYVTIVGLLIVTTFIMYFSPTPGASGIAEGVFGHFFTGVLTGNHLILVTVAWRFLTIYLGMLVGVAVTQLELMRSKRESSRSTSGRS